jgi:hypothetical protein
MKGRELLQSTALFHNIMSRLWNDMLYLLVKVLFTNSKSQ